MLCFSVKTCHPYKSFFLKLEIETYEYFKNAALQSCKFIFYIIFLPSMASNTAVDKIKRAVLLHLYFYEVYKAAHSHLNSIASFE